MNRFFSSLSPVLGIPTGVGAAVLVIVAGAALALYLTHQPSASSQRNATRAAAFQQGSSETALSGSQSSQQTQSAALTATPQVALNGNVRTFRGLGFQFSVSAQDVRGNDLPVSVSGNKVTIGTLDGVPYFAQVFTKAANDTFELALTKQFLQGYSSTECKIRVATNVTNEGYPASLEKAEIYPMGDPGKCPGSYTTFDEQRFFLMDTKHPDKYVFVSGGQTPIDQPVSGKNWEQTISFN